MNSRERLLTAIENKKPDRLPCQVHNWMQYYLDNYLHGMDQYQAYDYFDMDAVIYTSPHYIIDDSQLSKWQSKYLDFGISPKGRKCYGFEYTTPEGVLRHCYEGNEFTFWETEYLVKTEADMELFLKYYPVASKVDWTPVLDAKKKIGDRGIVRSHHNNFGQPGVWQCITMLMGVENTILKALGEPDFIKNAAERITKKCLAGIEAMGKIEVDIIENGGGAASSTVISPAMYKEFCLPYDKQIHDALKAGQTKVVYHLCGGLMHMLELAAQNGADGLETMTPAAMGGDCILSEAAERVGDKLFFIGGFDQNAGFEKGTKKNIEEQVHALFNAKPRGGYICSPSDHFFFGDPQNIKYFVDVCKSCRY